MNGALNCSILDGWWPEAFDSRNGWAIQVDHAEGIEGFQRDQAEAQALYRILSDEIVPSYYGREGDAAPADWVRRMKHAILTVAPAFSSDRMVRDYTRDAYYPEAGD
jgi:starch phosphorylase